MGEDGSESTAPIIGTDQHRDCYVSKFESPPHVIDVDSEAPDKQIHSKAPQNPSRLVNSTPETATQPSSSCKTHLSNPIAQAFWELELGKAFLPYIVPTATILLALQNKGSSPHVFDSILCLLCAALAALLYGNSLREIFPNTANACGQFGVACVYTSFFMVVGFHLHPALVWFPLICFLACIGLSVLSCLPIKKDCVDPSTRLPI